MFKYTFIFGSIMSIEDDIKQEKFSSAHNKAIVNIMFTGNWLVSSQNHILRPHGISVQQYNILRILRGQTPQPISINSLISRMLDKMSNASRLVEKLRQKGYVERAVCPDDRRQVDVFITESGLNFLAKVDVDIKKLEASIGDLSDEEFELLSQLLDKVRG